MGISGVVASSLCLWIPGAFYRRKEGVQVKAMWKIIHQIAISIKLGLDWQLSLPLTAPFLSGKERPTITRLTWSLCPAELHFSAFGSNHSSVLLWFCTKLSFHGSVLCLD